MNALEDTDAEIYAHMSDHRAGAFFYLPKPETRSLIELVRTSGMAHPGVRKLETGAEIASGGWGPLVGVLARRREHARHVALELYFSYYSYAELYDGSDYERRETHPVEDDPGMPLAYAFRDTSLRLDPEVGILTVNPLVLDTELQERDVYPLIERIDGWAQQERRAPLPQRGSQGPAAGARRAVRAGPAADRARHPSVQRARREPLALTPVSGGSGAAPRPGAGGRRWR